MSERKDNLSFIATARCIGILLVVFGHSYPFDVQLPMFFWKLREWIYLFHMPLFIFISGYLLARSHRPAGEYIGRRAKKLLIPYVGLSLAAFLPKVLVQQFLNDSVELSVWHLLKTELIPRDNVWGHFWYIPVVFILGCAGILMLKHMRISGGLQAAVVVMTLALLFAPPTTDWLALEDIRKNAFYFTLGMVVSMSNECQSVFRHPVWLLALPASVVLFRIWNTTATGVLVACGMIGFIMFIGTRWNVKGWMKEIEGSSFTIYLLSWPAQAVTEVLLNKLIHLPALLVMVCMFLSGVIVPMICIKIITAIDKKIPIGWIKAVVGM